MRDFQLDKKNLKNFGFDGFLLCFQDVIADKLRKLISFYVKLDKWS